MHLWLWIALTGWGLTAALFVFVFWAIRDPSAHYPNFQTDVAPDWKPAHTQRLAVQTYDLEQESESRR